METIDAIEESKTLSEGNPSVAALLDLFKTLADESENDLGLQIYYCERVVRKFFYGPTQQHLVEKLRENLYAVESQSSDEEVLNLARITLWTWYLESGDYFSAQGVLVDWEHMANDNPQFYYLASRTYTGGLNEDIVNRVLEDAYTAVEESDSAYFRYNLAYVLLDVYDSGFSYGGKNDKIPSDMSVALELADDMVETALNTYGDAPLFYITKAEIAIKRSNWDEAKAAINQGLQSIKSERDGYTRLFLRFRLLEYQLDSEKERTSLNTTVDQLRSETNDINQDIGELSTKRKDLREKLEKESERINETRTKFIQFLAFFAALLAVTISSTQIISSGVDFDTAFRLIVSLTGSLLVAFGGFSTMFVTSDEGFSIAPPILMIVLGFAAIGMGFII